MTNAYGKKCCLLKSLMLVYVQVGRDDAPWIVIHDCFHAEEMVRDTSMMDVLPLSQLLHNSTHTPPPTLLRWDMTCVSCKLHHSTNGMYAYCRSFWDKTLAIKCTYSAVFTARHFKHTTDFVILLFTSIFQIWGCQLLLQAVVWSEASEHHWSYKTQLAFPQVAHWHTTAQTDQHFTGKQRGSTDTFTTVK